MYIIEIRVGGNWEVASSHTKSEDRDVQRQRFLDQGVAEVDLRYTEN